jgi:hypothetical protein
MPATASAQASGPTRPNHETASERKSGKRGARGIPATDVPAGFMVDLPPTAEGFGDAERVSPTPKDGGCVSEPDVYALGMSILFWKLILITY